MVHRALVDNLFHWAMHGMCVHVLPGYQGGSQEHQTACQPETHSDLAKAVWLLLPCGCWWSPVLFPSTTLGHTTAQDLAACSQEAHSSHGEPSLGVATQAARKITRMSQPPSSATVLGTQELALSSGHGRQIPSPGGQQKLTANLQPRDLTHLEPAPCGPPLHPSFIVRRWWHMSTFLHLPHRPSLPPHHRPIGHLCCCYAA